MIYLHRAFRSGVFFVLFFLAFKEMFAQVKIGDQAPAIKITDWVQKNSKDTSLNGKFVIIDFWATWCAPCLASMAHVNELVEEFKQNENLVFLAMSDEPKEKISPLLSRVPFKASVVTDTSGYTQNDYSITSIPDCVIIDDKGQVQWTGNPKYLTKSIIEGILARKKIEMPNVNKRSKDANEIRYDSLTRIYRSIYS
ncbi:MAG: TlpA family protein disulfide reductase, partial [Sediminibacterium sp.]